MFARAFLLLGYNFSTMNNTELRAWVNTELKSHSVFKSEFDSADLKNIVACMDLTTLNSTDSPNSVRKFVEDALALLKEHSLPKVAAFCVFSNFASQVTKQLEGIQITTACVATAFPHGQAELKSKVLEVSEAVKAGADDVDVVINRGMVLDNDYEALANEILAFSDASGKAHLKVILEVCELNLEQVYLTSKVAIDNGADFIKTSTGKGATGASLEASLVMCLAIKEHYESTQKMVGFKAAGGISNADQAMQYWNLVNQVLGSKWMNNRYFRIGASSLLKNIIADLH